MSEDCHESGVPETTEVTVLCAECGQPVKPEESFPGELTHVDGTTEIAIFPSSFEKLCPLKWSTKRLVSAGNKLALILLIYKDILESNRGQL